ncbi:hypothetical protein RhiirA4_459736 [Rhizophagus irregularis]|uniref:Uncharacterized protein n=1 Tax=Rhizophagus irregularis TaxID=588596 RepID=A0A2I1GF33_9GLOM|nr:hypothetical protein RhiirA4_459736 [Rhizophagus irregularis]
MSSIIKFLDIKEYNAEDFMDSVEINKNNTNEDKSEDDKNDGILLFLLLNYKFKK